MLRHWSVTWGAAFIALLVLACPTKVLAQAPTIPPVTVTEDSLATVIRIGSKGSVVDSFGRDSIGFDGIPSGAIRDSSGRDSLRTPGAYRLSPDALTAKVDYKMVDSMRYSVAEKKIRLYRQAEVKYTDITLAAGYMEIDYGTNIVSAEPRIDSVGEKAELPSFSQGPQAFTSQGLRYNFDTRKGIITNAVTQQGDLYVLGGRTKIVAADQRDPFRADNTVYNQDAIITTCNLDHPHYGIRSSKQKVIPGKQVIVGPSNVELGGVPTPLWLPFGFFPIGSSEKSGLIFPSDYTYTTQSGFGFEGVGWYFPWNDKIHTAVTTDLFLKGTLRTDLTTQYSARYKYAGQFNINFARNRTEDNEGRETFAKSGALIWSHAQDAKAHPYRTFSANVNFQTNNNGRRNYASALNQTTNTASSTVNYSVRFPSHPSWQLTSGLQATQNFNTRLVNVRAPNAQFRTGQIYPFANLGNSRSWYRKASIDYNAGLQGNLQTTDTTIFDRSSLQNTVFGAQQQARVAAPINVLKYFRVSPNVSYQETYYLDERLQFFRGASRFDTGYVVVDGDTVSSTIDTIVTSTRVDTLLDASGINTARAFSASINLSTQIFGTARFRIGALRGIRHIVTPSISAGYQPDYSRKPFGYYADLVDPVTGSTTNYLRFPTQPFSPGSLPDEQSFNISYSLGNRIESKVQTRGDSTTRIVSLINSLNFNGSYNPGRDSLKWSNVNVSGAQASFFQKIVRINLSSLSLGVYELNEALDPINKTLGSSGKFPVRVDNFSFGVSAGLNLAQARELIVGKERVLPENSIFGLINKFNISYNYSRNYNIRNRGGLWRTTANTVNVSGPLPITDKWSIRNITIGYDFTQRRITYPTLSLGRDLHCWEMDFFWSPAFNNQFTFSIRVKPSSLGFLSIPYRRGSSR